MTAKTKKSNRDPGALRMKLGFSPAQETASGAGTHGGSARARNRRDRGAERRRLRSCDWD